MSSRGLRRKETRARRGDPDGLAYRAVVARAYGEEPHEQGPDGEGDDDGDDGDDGASIAGTAPRTAVEG